MATLEPSTTCNWGPCHGCDVCVKEVFEVFEAVKEAEANLKAASTEAQVKEAADAVKEAKENKEALEAQREEQRLRKMDQEQSAMVPPSSQYSMWHDGGK